MKVLVTGCAGFIGSHLVDWLLSRGDTVICVDNFNDYYDPIRKRKNISHNLNNPNFKIYESDILNEEGLMNIFRDNKIDNIVHLAARTGIRASIENPKLYEEVNVRGTLNLLELAGKNNIKHFVFASSSSVYGNNKKVPFSEIDNVDLPISPYAATKKAGELLCATYNHLYKFPVTCLRFFTVYGPRGRPDMAPYLFTKNILEGNPIKKFGDGSSRRDYTYIDDIVSGVISALDRPEGYQIFNLGNSETVELNQFINIIEELLNMRAKILENPDQPGDVSITYADISKAKKILNYNPNTNITSGMRKFIEWYKHEMT